MRNKIITNLRFWRSTGTEQRESVVASDRGADRERRMGLSNGRRFKRDLYENLCAGIGGRSSRHRLVDVEVGVLKLEDKTDIFYQGLCSVACLDSFTILWRLALCGKTAELPKILQFKGQTKCVVIMIVNVCSV